MTDQLPALAVKTCTRCGETKPLTDYYRSKGGIYPQCKTCHRAASYAAQAKRKAKDPDAFKQANTEAVRRHRERTGNARGKAYANAKAEAIRALIDAHPDEYAARLHLAKYEAGLL